MLLPQTKEREYRFKLALRMGLPIFALIIAFISHTFISSYDSLQSSFIEEAILVVLVSIYFIFYLIYNGFKVKITDDITNTFTREYLYEYLEKEIKNHKDYSLILISIDNLNDINSLYGIKNGDKVLKMVVEWIALYLKEQKIENFPIGHVQGGDFIIGLEGNKSQYAQVLDMLCLKSTDLKIDDIEVSISGAIIDTSYSKELGYLVDNLFEQQEKKRYSKQRYAEENINPNELENLVVEAIKNKSLDAMSQNIYDREGNLAFRECFIKLKGRNGKLIFPKTYLKIINKLGLGVSFDLMVIESIVSQCKGDTLCSLNVLPTSLRNDLFLSKLKEILRDKEVHLMFVLSEIEYYSHISKYNNIIKSLKGMGIKIAIDRLGSIHTSFLYLRDLEVDFVRFDTYYSNIKKLKKNLHIVDGFNIMAHEKGVKTWMKNIEDEESYNLAKDLKIDYLQGKYLSKLEKKEV